MKIKLPVIEKPITLRRSFSRWDTFANRCERQHALDIFFPPPPSPAMLKGTQVHNLLDWMADELREGRDPTSGKIQWPRGPLTTDELRPYFSGVLPLLRDWEILETEQWIRTPVAGLKWAGRIDLVASDADGPFVIDYKTCATTQYAKTRPEARRSLQLQVYCLAKDVRRAGFVYLPPSGVPKVVVTKFTDADLEIAARRIRALDATIAARWRATRVPMSEDGTKIFPSADEIDLTSFAPAGSELQWCSEKYCKQWKNCLGREENL